MTRRVLLEVCVGSLEDALVAQQGGADRIELNSALSLGGLTPSFGTVKLVRRAVPLPLIVMLRPREGGFWYSEAEFETMLADLDSLLELGVDGFAFGMLRGDGTVDVSRCREIRKRIGSKQAVFHRAFDLTHDPSWAVEELIDLGFDRVLTSGQEPTALEGSDTLEILHKQARGRIELLPASGIKPSNVRELLRRVPLSQVHASLKSERDDPSIPPDCAIRFSNRMGGTYDRTDLAKVIEMGKILDSITDMVGDDSV
jgi:copper homeostasis protein